ncbi:hypothetical protein MTO96_036557 [Rhipicephalus appendiculatus]
MSRLPGIHIYTDGSFTDRLAGAAFIVLGPSERIGTVGRYRVDHATSAYCTEVIAVIEALRHVKNKGSATTVRLYTDCLSLLQAISEYRTTDSRVRDVKTLLRDISVPHVLDAPTWFPPNKALVSFLTEHGRFYSYFHRFNLLAEPVCSCGAACEGTDHYLYECPLTKQLTMRIQPREDYEQRRYASLLRHAKNRALFIRLVKLVGDTIPDLT